MAITINGSGITSSEIADGTIVNADINSSAAIASSKVSGAGDNTPSFSVTKSSDQSYGSGVWTKVVLDTEQHDTDSAFDSSTNYRFTTPSGEGGTYVFTGFLSHRSLVNTGDVWLVLYKNGSVDTASQTIDFAEAAITGNMMQIPFTFTIALNASDYVELYVKHGMGGTRYIDNRYTRFIGYKLAGV